MRTLILGLVLMAWLVGPASAEDPIAVLKGTMFRIDGNGNLWRQKGSFWLEVRSGVAYRNTQRMSASQSDNLLIVLQNNWLHAVNPDTGTYTVLTRA